MRRTLYFALATVGVAAHLCAWAGNPASAQVIYSNINAGTGGSDPVSDLGPLYDSFTSAAVAGELSDVQLRLSIDSDPIRTTQVGLYSDNSTSPGSLLASLGTIDDSSLPNNPSVIDLPIDSPVALAANTRYWLGLSSFDGSGDNWSWSNDDSGIGVAGEFFSNRGLVFPNVDGPYEMQITEGSGSSPSGTPEPGSFALFGGGSLVGIAMLRRRR